MKKTLEIPDELLQRIRMRAMRENRTLEVEIITLLELGLGEESPLEGISIPFKLKDGHQLTAEEIRAAIDEGRE